MKKIIYWLKKVGILRSGVYKAKGDAKKMVQMEIDSELYQSDKEIEKEAQEKSGGDPKKVVSEKSKSKVGKIFFWIMIVIGAFFLLAFLANGLGFWSIVGIIMWVFFLKWTWKHISTGSLALGKMLVLVAIVFVVSMVIATSEEEGMGINVDIEKEGEAVNNLHDAYLGEGVEDDAIVDFLLELKEDTKINFSRIQNDNVSWPAGDISLELQKVKSFTAEDLLAKDFDKIQNYFLSKGADDGGVGFIFVPPVGTKSSGFALRQDPYEGIMCILMAIDNEGVLIGCGWGPTDNPNSK